MKRYSKPRKEKSKIIISTEDKISSPNYFEAVKKFFKIVTQDVKIVITRPKGENGKSSPKHVYKRAEENTEEGDTVYIVVDKDDHKDFDKVKNDTLKKENWHFIPSIPCFEYWLLLHYKQTDREFTSSSVTKELSKLIKADKNIKYEKNIDMSIFMDKIDTAVLNSKNCKENNNPSTKVHEVIEKLQSCKNKYF
jgi:hypothetical protein